MIKTIYLANAYGFSTLENKTLLPLIITELQKLRLKVIEPFHSSGQAGYSGQTAYSIGQTDKRDVEECDGFFGVVNGNHPDEGVMIELGIAIALEKPTFLFRDDFRKFGDSSDYPLNLMLFSGMPKTNWHDYYYQSIDEIGSPNKALYKWVNES